MSAPIAILTFQSVDKIHQPKANVVEFGVRFCGKKFPISQPIVIGYLGLWCGGGGDGWPASSTLIRVIPKNLQHRNRKYHEIINLVSHIGALTVL